MPKAVSKVLAVLGVVLLALVVFNGAVGAAAKKKGNATTSSLNALVAKTNKLPAGALPKAKRSGLQKAAKTARSLAAKSPCGSVSSLSRFRRILAGIKVKKGKKGAKAGHQLALLGPLSLKASSNLLASKRTKSCGGGTKPSSRTETKVKILKSDANGMKLQVQLPKLQFIAKTGGGKAWTALAISGGEPVGAPGDPGIPVDSSVIGVPDGAKVVVKTSDVDSYTLDGVDVYPAQPDPADAIAKAPNFDKPPFVNKSFAFDPKAYNTKGLQPASPADGNVLGQARDLTIGNLVVPAVQYDPNAKKLKVLTSVEVKVDFKGGTHTFSDELGSPWEQAQGRTAASLLNRNILVGKFPPIIYQPCGAEMLVITNPATRVAADTFATARRKAGYLTLVVETGAGAGQIGTIATAIQAYIRARLTAPKCIHPSYVTIMGDDEMVPTFTDGPSGIPADLKYSMRDDADELPDVAVGRILGADQAQVGAAVAKIIGYETTVPSAPGFLSHATLAAQFQDTESAEEVNDGQEIRTFSRFAEQVRKRLVNNGITVDRVYADNPITNPLKFNDGTSVPPSLQKPTFPWTGDASDVSKDWNAGRFMIIHRDHGWSDGWGDPFFTTTEVEALKNGALLPVVMSINCASAQYDTDETSFVQQALVKPDGGAVGVFGDTRNSPSWHNSEIGLGFVDGLLPYVLPSEGPASKQRVGDALINGKLRLAGLSPPSGPGISGGDGNTRKELYLWHYFGDPSMQMWGGDKPTIYAPPQFKAIYKAKIGNPPGPEPFFVDVTLPTELAGQPISLLRNGQVIGKAIAGDGSVSIGALFADGAAKPGELQIAVEADGSPPVNAPVDGVPKVPTTLEQTCPKETAVFGGPPIVVNGTLTGAPAGSTVVVTFNPPTGGPTVVNATTDAKGGWSASIQPTGNQTGTWTVSSQYAGTAQLAESKAGPCQVEVDIE